jgi:Apolipoprotein O
MTYYDGKAVVTNAVDKWISVEKQVEKTLYDVAPKGEETIIPAAIYVGIAGMGGSILARNRTLPHLPNPYPFWVPVDNVFWGQESGRFEC